MRDKKSRKLSYSQVVLLLVLLLGLGLKCELLPLDQNSHEGLHFQENKLHQLVKQSPQMRVTLTPMVKLQHRKGRTHLEPRKRYSATLHIPDQVEPDDPSLRWEESLRKGNGDRAGDPHRLENTMIAIESTQLAWFTHNSLLSKC
jgi:hypothetical protein